MSYEIYSKDGADAKFLTEVDGGDLDAAPLPITLRRGTTAERNASNPILAAGEPAVVLDSGQPAEMVLGDGVTAMADLRAAVWDDDARLAAAATATQPGDLGTAAAADAEDFATAAQAATRLQYSNAYDGFFGGRNSATDTSSPTIWANSTHLTNAGLRAWADFVVSTLEPAGAAPKVVWFGDSWVQQGAASILADATHAAIPGATVVVSGEGGDNSADLIARFDTDVPADADVVIFNEPGVNDAAGGNTAATQLDNLTTLVRYITDRGAAPVYTGHVPLTGYPNAENSHTRLTSIIGTGKDFLAAAGTQVWKASTNQPESSQRDSIGLNPTALSAVGAFTPGNSNTAVGHNAGAALTTGRLSTAVGAYALEDADLAIETTAIGAYALASVAPTAGAGHWNTAVGANAGRAVTTGQQNLFIGPNAGYMDAADSTANAITTGDENTFVGNRTGGTSATVYWGAAIGVRATVNNFGTAIGAGTRAVGAGSVAIGVDGTGASAEALYANLFALGTQHHIVEVKGYLQVDRSQATVGAAGGADAPPATPSRYFTIRGDDGLDYVVPGYAKA